MKTILSILIFILFLYALNAGIKKQEKAECQRWTREATQYVKWEWTDWQKAQCGIKN